MADEKKEYKDMLAILRGMATPSIASTNLEKLSMRAEDGRLKNYARDISNWVRNRGGVSSTKLHILTVAKHHAADANSRDHQMGKGILSVEAYCQKQIDSALPTWQIKASANGWVADWEATATANHWTPPSPADDQATA